MDSSSPGGPSARLRSTDCGTVRRRYGRHKGVHSCLVSEAASQQAGGGPAAAGPAILIGAGRSPCLGPDPCRSPVVATTPRAGLAERPKNAAPTAPGVVQLAEARAVVVDGPDHSQGVGPRPAQTGHRQASGSRCGAERSRPPLSLDTTDA